MVLYNRVDEFLLMFVGFINSVMMKMTPSELFEVPKTKGEFCKLNILKCEVFGKLGNSKIDLLPSLFHGRKIISMFYLIMYVLSVLSHFKSTLKWI